MFDQLEAPAETDPVLPPEVAPEDLVDELAVLFTQRDRLEARIAETLRQTNESEAFRRDGYPSMTALLKHRMSLHPGEALRLVSRANGLAGTPLVAMAFDTGAVSGAQVDVLLEVAYRAPSAFIDAEAALVELALDTPSIRDLRKRLDYWLDQMDPDELAASRNVAREIRATYIRRDGDMMRFNGWTDLESGEMMKARLDPGPPAPGETRSTAARRTDLLIDILGGAGDRPHVIVHVSDETLLSGTRGLSETGSGTFLTAEEIARIACDASITRVVFGPESQPLDVGRTSRLVTPALKTAVTARDLECVFPICDRPEIWCDVHHLHPWQNGGETKIENLVLLCRYHHTLIHEGRWRIKGKPGNLRFYRPDGTELDLPHRPEPPTNHRDRRSASPSKRSGGSEVPSGRGWPPPCIRRNRGWASTMSQISTTARCGRRPSLDQVDRRRGEEDRRTGQEGGRLRRRGLGEKR
jgi:hypothetical protein